MTAKPNILFIMTDQQRWDAIGANAPWIKTPHLDQIANRGINFSNCVTNSPVCKAARMALATGLYPHNTGIWGRERVTLSPDTNTWMKRLRDAGHRTSLFGKTHLHEQSEDLRHGESLLHAYGLDDVDEISGPWQNARVRSHMTERWRSADLLDSYKADVKERQQSKREFARPSALPLRHYPDVYVAQQAKQYLQRYEGFQPWFCWLSFCGPHRPWDAPEPYASMYSAQDMPSPVECKRVEWEGAKGYLAKRLVGKPPVSAEEAVRLRANYAGNVSLIDDQIGEVLTTIEQRGETDNTIIVFTSDHGELAGDYGLVDKRVFLDGAVRVPLIISTPDIASGSLVGSSCSSLIELIDLGPTLLDLIGDPIQYQQYGRSFSQCLSAPTASHREFVVSEIFGERMYMDEEWKFAVNASADPYLLFDRNNDPVESRNLVNQADKKELCAQLELKLSEFARRTHKKARVTSVSHNESERVN